MWRNILQPLRLGKFLSFFVLFLVLFGVFNAFAELEAIPATEYTWTEPVNGAPVHHYYVQVLVNDTELREYDFIPEASIMVQFEYGNKYEVRVAGVAANGDRGGFSPWSTAYSPELGLPGF